MLFSSISYNYTIFSAHTGQTQTGRTLQSAINVTSLESGGDYYVFLYSVSNRVFSAQPAIVRITRRKSFLLLSSLQWCVWCKSRLVTSIDLFPGCVHNRVRYVLLCVFQTNAAMGWIVITKY